MSPATDTGTATGKTKSLAGLLSSSSIRINPDPPSPSTPIADSISAIHTFMSKWDPHTSLSSGFLSAATHLHSYLLHLSTSSANSSHRELIRANSLLQSAMRRLNQELKHHLLSISDIHSPADQISTVRAIVETMLSTGYGEECITTYQSMRRSAVTSQLKQLGFDISVNRPRKIFKVNWDTLDYQTKSWLDAASKAVCRVFYSERQISDSIFGASPEPIRHSVFASVVNDIAVTFFSFPETVSMRSKHLPERIFSLLDMHEKITILMPDIEILFGCEPASMVLSKVTSSLTNLTDAARMSLYEFEKAIRKAKPNTPPGGGIVSLTRYVMNYLVCLFDYEASLYMILSSMPQETNEASIDISDDWYGSPVSVRIAWLLFVLLQKLESMAESYRDVALSYLFLVNNLQYVVSKVKNSSLKEGLSEDWVAVQETKVRRYMEGHVRSGWAHVSAALPVKEEEHVERVREFEMVFQKVMKEREGWVIVDERMREEVRQLVEGMVAPAYRGWYQVYRRNTEVRFTPEFIRSRILRLYDDPESRSGSNSSSSSVSGTGSNSSNSAKLLCRFGCYLPQEGDMSMSVRHHAEFDGAQKDQLLLQYNTREGAAQQGEVSLRIQIQDLDQSPITEEVSEVLN
ncbi:exocyst complex component EXO70H1-like [Carex rostrata]